MIFFNETTTLHVETTTPTPPTPIVKCVLCYESGGAHRDGCPKIRHPTLGEVVGSGENLGLAGGHVGRVHDVGVFVEPRAVESRNVGVAAPTQLDSARQALVEMTEKYLAAERELFEERQAHAAYAFHRERLEGEAAAARARVDELLASNSRLVEETREARRNERAAQIISVAMAHTCDDVVSLIDAYEKGPDDYSLAALFAEIRSRIEER